MTDYVSEQINVNHENYQCDGNTNNPAAQHMDARGVTNWLGDTAQHTISHGDYWEINFTCTQPRCLATPDACNVFFRTYVSSNPYNEDVKIHWYLNGHDWQQQSISGVTGSDHGNYQAVDVGNKTVEDAGEYFNVGKNTFKIVNETDHATVVVDNIKVIRIYSMCGLQCDCIGLCDDTEACIAGTDCKSEGYPQPIVNFVTPVDYPCNLDGYGTRGFTYHLDPYFKDWVLSHGDSFRWDFDFYEDSQGIYQEQQVCLFNFNQIWLLSDNTSNNSDVELQAFLNGASEPFTKYHLSNRLPTQYRGIFPSFDLATLSNYNDSGSNYVRLVNASDVDVQMSPGDGINIYRTYVTDSAASCNCSSCQSCDICYFNQGCGVCNACYVGCEVCQPCEDCQACQESCQAACYITCQPSCYMCQTACELGCLSCQSCYGTCEFCNGTCEECMVTCQGCEPGYY
jgi:hypothetical protein